jgi:hypothetical protein
MAMRSEWMPDGFRSGQQIGPQQQDRNCMANKQLLPRESALPRPVGQDENRHYGQSKLLRAQGQADAKPQCSQTQWTASPVVVLLERPETK